MTTIAQIQKSMRAFDTFARTSADPKQLQTKWHSLFSTQLDNKAANSFVQYYRKMKSRTSRKQRGGMAPLNYQMTSGSPNVSVYGRFPVEVGTDPASIKDLDVYFHNALTLDCGNPAQAAAFPTPSSGMGSNQVGGRSRRGRRQSRKSRRQTVRHRNRYNKRKTNRRRQRGGNLGESILMRPYLATPPPNALQAAVNGWQGNPAQLPFSGNPVQQQWQYVSNGTAGIINPGLITPIGTEFRQLASLDPYQTAS
jgi:hypothetical protein